MCRCLVPLGTYIAQIVAVACVHIWASGQVLGISAQLQVTGLCPPPRSLSAHWLVCMVGDSSALVTGGMQAHFPGVDRTASISRMARLGLLSTATARAVSLWSACTVCTFTGWDTAIDLTDRLNYQDMCADLIG